MEDAEAFAKNLMLAKEYCALLVNCFNRIREFAINRMSVEESQVPVILELTE